MQVYATEEEQVDALKQWCIKHGKLLVGGAVLSGLLLAGWYYKKHHQSVLNLQASEQYMHFVDALKKKEEEKEEDTMQYTGKAIMQDYSSSGYASFAALDLAWDAFEHKKYDESVSFLQWVMKNSQYGPLQGLARTRLMRVYMAQDKDAEALACYDAKKAYGYLTLMAELQGDIWLRQGKKEEARAAYKTAFEAAPEVGMQGPLLKMKIEALGSVEVSEKS